MKRQRRRDGGSTGKEDKFFTRGTVVTECCRLAAERMTPTSIDASASSDATPLMKIRLIDFSAGPNLFAREMLSRFSNRSQHASFDVDVSSCQWGAVIEKDWLKTTTAVIDGCFAHDDDEDDTTQRVTVVGFNPPFGFKHKTINEFVLHADRVVTNVDWFCLLVPVLYRMPAKLAPRYVDVSIECSVPLDAYHLPDGSPYVVPTKFVMWKRRNTTVTNDDNDDDASAAVHCSCFTLQQVNCDADVKRSVLLVRRVGAQAGEQVMTHDTTTGRLTKYYRDRVMGEFADWAATGVTWGKFIGVIPATDAAKASICQKTLATMAVETTAWMTRFRERTYGTSAISRTFKTCVSQDLLRRAMSEVWPCTCSHDQ
jgi:hypothetical protein